MVKSRPRRGSPLHLTPSFELFGKSRDLVIKNIWIFAPLYVLPTIFIFHSWIWTPARPETQSDWWVSFNWFGYSLGASSVPSHVWYSLIGFSVLWFLFAMVVGTIVRIMTQAAQLEAAQGKTVTFSSIWQQTKELGWRMFGLYIVIALVLVVGFILLIVPGLIFLRRYFLAPYVMLDKKVGISESMSRSAAMSKPHSGSVWGVIGVMFLISLTGIIPLVGWLISFILGLLYSVAAALRYEELKRLS